MNAPIMETDVVDVSEHRVLPLVLNTLLKILDIAFRLVMFTVRLCVAIAFGTVNLFLRMVFSSRLSL